MSAQSRLDLVMALHAPVDTCTTGGPECDDPTCIDRSTICGHCTSLAPDFTTYHWPCRTVIAATNEVDE